MLFNDKKSHLNGSSRFIHITITLIILFLSVLYSSCKDDIIAISAKDNLSNPSVMPHVVSTYPPNGGIGPFNILNTSRDYSLPNFIITFNKLIDLSSITKSSIKVLGFGPYSYVSVQATSYSNFSNILYCNVYDSLWYASTYFHAGQLYTVIVDPSVKDINGNHLNIPYQFSFTPKPTFELLDIDPDSNYQNVSPKSDITLLFNSQIDSSILNDIDVSPLIDFYYQLSYDSMSIILSSKNDLLSNQNYTITVYAGAHDKFHTPLQRTYHSTFHTMGFKFSNSYPQNNYTDVSTAGLIYFSFTSRIVYTSIAPSFQFSPPIHGHFEDSEYLIRYIIDSPMIEDTTYTITILPTLTSRSGATLDSTISIRFKTTSLQINSFSPSNNEDNISRYRGIQIYCNANIDTNSVRPAFSMLPPTSGIFQMSNNNNTFYFQPTSPMIADTMYTVTIGTQLRSAHGKPLKNSRSFIFYTGH